MLATIQAELTAAFGPLGPLMALGGLGMALIIATLPFLLRRRQDPFEKLKSASPAGPPVPRSAPNSRGAALRPQSRSTRKLDKFANLLEPKTAEEMSEAHLKLTRAGYRTKSAVRMYHAAQFVFGISGLLLGLLYALLNMATGGPSSMQAMMISILVPGGAGYMLPKYWISRRTQIRQTQIAEGFPDSLDLMLVCVEAGQSFDQALLRVAKEIAYSFPALAEEYEIVSQEIKAGKDKTRVLKDLGERSGVQDVNAFVTVLIQSQSFGTSIGEALRVYSADMRDKRVMRAEEKANKIPTKLTLGTMMFTLPPLLLILIGPSLYRVANMMSTMGK